MRAGTGMRCDSNILGLRCMVVVSCNECFYFTVVLAFEDMLAQTGPMNRHRPVANNQVGCPVFLAARRLNSVSLSHAKSDYKQLSSKPVEIYKLYQIVRSISNHSDAKFWLGIDLGKRTPDCCWS
ncbi:hypothetical protein ElyMa_005039300 [Elysia marginata]|uniref:Uncharacterized protein n=1 Tax=Elysia marginata TaxID=1093978 RepID=A0AAV4JCP5_9GAST|nr:hypothetical protein ElyMa_005039300 [Elysia marginata]